jgi:pyruvate dehydrogenase E1 component beta subunit
MTTPCCSWKASACTATKGEVPDGEYLLPIGVADIKRPGKDATIVSFGKMMKVALGAAEELAKEGIDAR